MVRHFDEVFLIHKSLFEPAVHWAVRHEWEADRLSKSRIKYDTVQLHDAICSSEWL